MLKINGLTHTIDTHLPEYFSQSAAQLSKSSGNEHSRGTVSLGVRDQTSLQWKTVEQWSARARGYASRGSPRRDVDNWVKISHQQTSRSEARHHELSGVYTD